MHPAFPLPDLAVALTSGFWAAAATGVLAIPRCDQCNAWCWYPVDACPECNGSSMPWTATSGRGSLFSYAVVHHAFLPAFADLIPFVTGLVVLEEAPRIRVATRIVDADPDRLRTDMAVEVVFRPLRFGTVAGEVVAPFFRPCDPAVPTSGS